MVSLYHCAAVASIGGKCAGVYAVLNFEYDQFQSDFCFYGIKSTPPVGGDILFDQSRDLLCQLNNFFDLSQVLTPF